MKLSVSIVTFQHEPYIRQSLTSVLDQEADFDFEVVVGDDASTDATPRILTEMSEASAIPVRLLLASSNYGDSGLSNFMATLDATRGEYIAFLDGDDYWTSHRKLQRQVDFLDRNPDCALCCHRVEHHYPNGERFLSPRPVGGEDKYPVDRLIVTNFAEKLSTMVRRSALESLPDWYRTTPVIAADWLFNVLTARAGKVGFIDDVLAVHRQHRGSLTMLHGTERVLADKLECLRSLDASMPESRLALRRAQSVLHLKLGLLRLGPGLYMGVRRLFAGLPPTGEPERPNSLQGTQPEKPTSGVRVGKAGASFGSRNGSMR